MWWRWKILIVRTEKPSSLMYVSIFSFSMCSIDHFYSVRYAFVKATTVRFVSSVCILFVENYFTERKIPEIRQFSFRGSIFLAITRLIIYPWEKRRSVKYISAITCLTDTISTRHVKIFDFSGAYYFLWCICWKCPKSNAAQREIVSIYNIFQRKI